MYVVSVRVERYIAHVRTEAHADGEVMQTGDRYFETHTHTHKRPAHSEHAKRQCHKGFSPTRLA